MFNKYKKKYEKEKHIKEILFLVYPTTYFIWSDIENLSDCNYPLKDIKEIMRKRYNV